MSIDILKEFSVSKINDLYAVYFFEKNIDFSNPIALCIRLPGGKSRWITSNGRGRFRVIEEFSAIYYAAEIGFTFLAPIQLSLPKNIQHSSNVSKISNFKTDKHEIIYLEFSNKFGFSLKFEDDSIFILAN
ncbi:hypothetical protein [Rhodospirillum sp. A1_3_36]|uniref:hypothetical protein n=1 Tax=Rhodospirillum sp. A1_3_36 TaxID=3391666 RepID=UPI0039A419DA